MKKYLIIVFLSLNTIIAFSQRNGDNIIKIENFKVNKDLTSIKKILIINGYELYEFDTIVGNFSTQPHPIEGSVYAYNLNVKIIGYIQNNDLILMANYSSQYPSGVGGMEDASGRAMYHTRKLIAKRLAFDELQRIALKIDPDLMYSKE